MESIFMDKSSMPTDQDLEEMLGSTYNIWNDLKNHLNETLVDPIEKWIFLAKNMAGALE